MHIIILYGSTEGQTRKIAEFLGDKLKSAGQEVEILDAANLPQDYRLPACDRVLVAASLHNGRYQAAVEHFAKANRQELHAVLAIFISVSLSAARHSDEDRRGLDECVSRFVHESGWTPHQVLHVAGAFRFTQYDFLKRWAMKYIAWRKGEPTDATHDREYTDWDALSQYVEEFASSVAQKS